MLKPLLDPCSIIRVQTWDCGGAEPAKVERVVGISWPQETGAVANGRGNILCTGPSDWLFISGDPDAAALLQQLEEAFEGSSFRATNVSSALARIELESPEVRALLAKACSLDLHPSRFPPGRCARTRFAGIPVIIHCTRTSTFECIVVISYAEYLNSLLADAALEFTVAL
jgi:sarcosine oxidase subunit gamma